MSRTYDQGPVSDLQPSQLNAADQGTPNVNQFDSAWMGSSDRPRVALGTAAGLTLCASLATALILRRRAEARATRTAWLAMQAGRLNRIPYLRQSAPFGGAGALLLSTLLVARARMGQTRPPLGELTDRLDRLHTQADTQLFGRDKVHPRDVLLGGALALGLAGLISRVGARQQANTNTAS